MAHIAEISDIVLILKKHKWVWMPDVFMQDI